MDGVVLFEDICFRIRYNRNRTRNKKYKWNCFFQKKVLHQLYSKLSSVLECIKPALQKFASDSLKELPETRTFRHSWELSLWSMTTHCKRTLCSDHIASAWLQHHQASPTSVSPVLRFLPLACTATLPIVLYRLSCSLGYSSIATSHNLPSLL
jgi:hypothetical protein